MNEETRNSLIEEIVFRAARDYADQFVHFPDREEERWEHEYQKARERFQQVFEMESYTEYGVRRPYLPGYDGGSVITDQMWSRQDSVRYHNRELGFTPVRRTVYRTEWEDDNG